METHDLRKLPHHKLTKLIKQSPIRSKVGREAREELIRRNRELKRRLIEFRAVQRHQRKEAEQEPSHEKLYDLEKLLQIVFLLHKIFQEQAAISKWIYESPVPAFDNRLPIDLIRNNELDEILVVLLGILDGSFSWRYL